MPRSREVEPRSREVEPRSREVEPRSRDVEPRSREVEPRSREVALGGNRRITFHTEKLTIIVHTALVFTPK